MLVQEAVLVFFTLLAFTLAAVLYYRSPKPVRVEWYERGIGGYDIGGNRAYPVPGYLNIEVNPFDYPFSEMPSGTFNVWQPYKEAESWYVAIIGLNGLGWIMVNVPHLFTVAVIYFTFLLFSLIIVIAEFISPKHLRVTSAVAFGYGAWDGQVITGVLAGILFTFLSYSFKLLSFQVEALQVENMPVASAIIIILVVPLVEEATFRDVVGMSAGEVFGWVPGMFISAAIFGLFHAYVYQLNFGMIFLAFVFGLIAQFIDYKYKSMLPGLVAHSVVNAWALILS